MRWHRSEERYLRVLHDICNKLSKEYMELYTLSHSFQTKMRIPAIILSSCSGVASFGSAGFGSEAQRYIGIGVGIVNVVIAIIQTYESYTKIGDIVSKSLSSSLAFKKLADTIYCETFVPVENRIANGITFLRDCFARYQAILDQSPPLEFHGKKPSDILNEAHDIIETLKTEISSPRVSESVNPLATEIQDVPVGNPTDDKTTKSTINSDGVFLDMKTLMQNNLVR